MSLYNPCSVIISNIEKCITYNNTPIIIYNQDNFLELTECSDYKYISNKLNKLGINLDHKRVFTKTEITIFHNPISKTIIVSPISDFRHSDK